MIKFSSYITYNNNLIPWMPPIPKDLVMILEDGGAYVQGVVILERKYLKTWSDVLKATRLIRKNMRWKLKRHQFNPSASRR